MSDIRSLVEGIRTRCRHLPAEQSMLVAISGIDGSGKGYLARGLVEELQRQGVHAVAISVDGWLNLPSLRFSAEKPAEHFYEHAIRFGEMFEQLVLPLKRQRSIRVEANFTEETAQAYRRHIYHFQDVDVILLEGIFLLKRAFLKDYDYSIWVECSFETALKRALERGQEGLPADQTIHAYRTIYFPAQEVHFRLDEPRLAADAVWINDPRTDVGPPPNANWSN